MEPSGQAFNAIVCLPDQRPHNPCVNVGAIMACAVLASASPKLTAEEHTQHVMSKWTALCGGTGEVLNMGLCEAEAGFDIVHTPT